MSSLLAFLLLVLSVRIHGQQNEGTCPPGEGTQCITTHNGFYCSGSYALQSVCVDGYCRCPNNPIQDPCTCLAVIGSCHIQQDAGNRVGTPTFEGQSQTTYSCVAVGSCDYDIHVIGNYEGDGHTGFRVHNTGTTRVTIRVNGEVIRPIILAFVSYEPVNWILDIPSDVTIEKVLLSSYYLEDSFISGSVSRILEVERLSYQTLPYGYGLDTGGGHTDEVLQYLYSRFGPAASFSGSYRADSWTLNINPNTNCSSVTTAPPTTPTPTTQQTTQTSPATTDSTTSTCHIQKDAEIRVGTPTFEGESQTTYSCVAKGSCDYNVHVISSYEGKDRGFRVHNTANVRVNIRVSGNFTRPLVLVFASYEPINWILSIPSDVTIERALLGSYYLANSDITSNSRILAVERLTYDTLPYGYGSDSGGGNTEKLLQYLYDRFGPVSSLSGTYRADSWTLYINESTECSSVTVAPPAQSSPSKVAAIVSTVLVVLFIVVAISLCCVVIKRYNRKERTVVTHPRTYPSTTGTTVHLTQRPTAIAHPPPPPAPKPTDPTLTIEPPPPYSSAVSFPSVPPSIPGNYPPPPPFQENPSPLPIYTIQK